MDRTWMFLREPLLHFVLLASALIILSRIWSDAESPGNRPDSIVVSEARVLNLAQMWQRTWQRPPTRQELDGLIDDYIKEEVMYRHAMQMGLDRDDTIIRRRLQQKLEFVAEDLADSVEPSDSQLQEFLGEHAEDFQIPSKTSFSHVYLAPDRHAELTKDAEKLLSELRSIGAGADLAQFGDRFLLPSRFEEQTPRQSADLFGPEFPRWLQEAETGRWTGPIPSGYGSHLVYVHDRSNARQPELAEVRDAVKREWLAARRAESKAQFYQSLLDKYDVTIEMPSNGTSADQLPTAESSDNEDQEAP